MTRDSPTDFLADEILSSGVIISVLIDQISWEGRRRRHPRHVRDDALARVRASLAVTAERYDDADIELAGELLWNALEEIAATVDWEAVDSGGGPPRGRRPRGRRAH